MKRLLFSALLLSTVTLTFGQVTSEDTATWMWTAPTLYTDGTPIPNTVTLTYNLYVGTSGKGSESATPTETGLTGATTTTSGYAAGETICGTITAVAAGVEGPHSAESCKSFAAVPGSPGLSVK